MDHETITHEDYVRYDRVWQRVAPELDPYPEARAAAAMMPVPVKEAEECCCLAQTRADVEAIRDFIEHELADRRRLMGLYYIITGQCYRPALCAAPTEMQPWCQLLRRRYGEECAGGYAYRRAAEETEDACLRRILERFSADEYRHAELLLRLLEGNLPL